MTRHLRPVRDPADFLAAQPGQPDLALRIHFCGPDGRCAGCFGEHRQKWPCLLAGLALEVKARQKRAARRRSSSAPLEVLGVHGYRDDAAGPSGTEQDAGTGDGV